MILRFTEYRAVIMIMPARSLFTLALVCKRAVHDPATAPITVDRMRVRKGGHPAIMAKQETAAPVVKLPSMVKSANPIMRKESTRPRTANEEIAPSSIDVVIRDSIILLSSFLFVYLIR
jgi:hypothetical protein